MASSLSNPNKSMVLKNFADLACGQNPQSRHAPTPISLLLCRDSSGVGFQSRRLPQAKVPPPLEALPRPRQNFDPGWQHPIRDMSPHTIYLPSQLRLLTLAISSLGSLRYSSRAILETRRSNFVIIITPQRFHYD